MFKSVIFEVIGDQKLACEGCEERVEHALKSVEGIGQVRARASNQHIDVLFDTAKLDANTIAKRIENTGYQTRVLT